MYNIKDRNFKMYYSNVVFSKSILPNKTHIIVDTTKKISYYQNNGIWKKSNLSKFDKLGIYYPQKNFVQWLYNYNDTHKSKYFNNNRFFFISTGNNEESTLVYSYKKIKNKTVSLDKSDNIFDPINNSFDNKCHIMRLFLYGIGLSVSKKENSLYFTLGLSHKIKLNIPHKYKSKIDIQIIKNSIFIFGEDYTSIKSFASKIESLCKPDPYKGKGIYIYGKKYFKKNNTKNPSI